MPKKKLNVPTHDRYLSTQIEKGANLGQESPEDIQDYLSGLERRFGLQTGDPDDGFNPSL